MVRGKVPPDIQAKLAEIQAQAESDMEAIIMAENRRDARSIIRTVAALHAKATDQRNMNRVTALEQTCIAIAAVYGLPVANPRLFLASYWPDR